MYYRLPKKRIRVLRLKITGFPALVSVTNNVCMFLHTEGQYKADKIVFSVETNLENFKIGLHRILIWPDN